MTSPINVLHGERWKILRRMPRDRTGDSGFAEDGYVDDCVYSTGESVEMVNGQETVVTTSRLSMPRSAPVTPTDRLESPAGDLFRVDGRPKADRVSPFTGWDSGRKVFTIKAVG